MYVFSTELCLVIIQNPLFYDRLSSKSTLPVLKIEKRRFSIVWLAILMELVVNGPINQAHTMGRNILWKSSHFFSVTTILISPEVKTSVCLVLSNIIHNHKCRYYNMFIYVSRASSLVLRRTLNYILYSISWRYIL